VCPSRGSRPSHSDLSPDPFVEVELALQPLHGRQHGGVELEQSGAAVRREQLLEARPSLVKTVQR
jgi:hypothetical protein